MANPFRKEQKVRLQSKRFYEGVVPGDGKYTKRTPTWLKRTRRSGTGYVLVGKALDDAKMEVYATLLIEEIGK